MKKVYLTGYKNQNLGDDLFFITVLERYPHITFVFEDKPSCFYAKLFKGYKNVEVLPCLKENLLQRIRKKLLEHYTINGQDCTTPYIKKRIK